MSPTFAVTHRSPLDGRPLARHRRGFSLMELMTVIVMISMLSMVAFPRFSSANGRRQLESARLRFASGLATARQAAIQRGSGATFGISGNTVTVTAGGVNLITPVPLSTLYDVTVSPATATLVFSGRGFVTSGLSSASQMFVLTRSSGQMDTVTITRTGMIRQ